MSQLELLWPALMIASTALHSGASILKVHLESHFYSLFIFVYIQKRLTLLGVIQEFVFIDGARRLKVSTSCIFLEKTLMTSTCILNPNQIIKGQ